MDIYGAAPFATRKRPGSRVPLPARDGHYRVPEPISGDAEAGLYPAPELCPSDA